MSGAGSSPCASPALWIAEILLIHFLTPVLCRSRRGWVVHVIAASFARIFYRNALNIGFPILECPEAALEIQKGDEVSVDLETGVIEDKTTGKTYQANPQPPFIQAMIDAGGLLKYIKGKVEA